MPLNSSGLHHGGMPASRTRTSTDPAPPDGRRLTGHRVALWCGDALADGGLALTVLGFSMYAVVWLVSVMEIPIEQAPLLALAGYFPWSLNVVGAGFIMACAGMAASWMATPDFPCPAGKPRPDVDGPI